MKTESYISVRHAPADLVAGQLAVRAQRLAAIEKELDGLAGAWPAGTGGELINMRTFKTVSRASVVRRVTRERDRERAAIETLERELARRESGV